MDTHKTFIADSTAASQRLDRWLAARLPELSRTQLQGLIQKGRVRVGGQTVTRPSHPLAEADAVDVRVPPPKVERVEAQPIPLTVLFEDDQLIAVDKPAGMVVYPAPGHERNTLVNALLHHTPLASVGAPVRPGIVHRLDKDTSGVMVVAKTDAAYHGLVAQFKGRALSKTYLAWVWGRIAEGTGRIEAPIARHPINRKKMAVSPTGKPAASAFIVRRRLAQRTLVEVELITGRTHQIRVHFAYIKHPVVGDPVYGKKQPAPRMLLHAWKLALDHPASGQRLNLEAAVPEAFEAID